MKRLLCIVCVYYSVLWDIVDSAEGNYHNNREDFLISVPE